MNSRCFFFALVSVALGPLQAGAAEKPRNTAPEAPSENSGAIVKPAPLKIDRWPLLFVDDTGVASSSGVVHTVHVAKTRPEPVVQADRPWEGQRVYVYGSVYQNPTTGELQMWYQGSGPDAVKISRRGPEYSLKGGTTLLYATSKNGVDWTKPELNLYDFNGSGANNIVFSISSPSVLRDDRERDPQKRFKLLGSHGGYRAAYSADGLTWNFYPKNPVLSSGDTCTLTQDPRTGEYLAYHKRPAVIRGFARRVVWLSRSPDMQTWSTPELVFAPDATDDEWTTRANERTEVYDMSVYPHAAGFLGLPTIFRVYKQRTAAEIAPEQSPVDGPIDVQLLTSEDGRTWKRTWPRQNIIPRGVPGTFDAGTILGTTSTCVEIGDETCVYYTAITTGHGGALPEKRITIGRAAWRRHGFASLDAGFSGGRVATVPIQLSASGLEVNANAARGEVRVGLTEANGQAIPGLGTEDCEALKTDAIHWIPRWKGGATLPTDRPVCVVFQMTNTQLFSLSTPRAKMAVVQK